MEALLLVPRRLVPLPYLGDLVGPHRRPLLPLLALAESEGQLPVPNRPSYGARSHPALLGFLLYLGVASLESEGDLCAPDVPLHHAVLALISRSRAQPGHVRLQQPQVGHPPLLLLCASHLLWEIRSRVLPLPIHYMDDFLLLFHANLSRPANNRLLYRGRKPKQPPEARSDGEECADRALIEN